MKKRIARFLALLMAICLTIPTQVKAEEPIRNLTYEEYLERQENGIDETINTLDMNPVYIESQAYESQRETPQNYSSSNEELRILNSITSENIDLPHDIDRTKLANNISMFEMEENEGIGQISESDVDATVSGNIINDGQVKAIPVAGLIPIIVNEETLLNGNISTETWIAFFFNDNDSDGDTIAKRYVGGSASDFIIGEVDGGFVVNITVAGTYTLLYQVEDSNGELSEVIGFTIDVVDVPADNDYQVFEGSFSSAEDSKTYNFSIDFTKMDSAAVCLVRKGYVGTSIQVFDENGDRVVYRSTQMGQPKNWQYIDKPSADAGICNYSMIVTPNVNEYGNGVNDYRIIVGDKNETELMMSGIENTVLLEHYVEGKSRVENTKYLPNKGEYWYKYRANSEVITVLSDTSNLRFKIKAVSDLHDMYDSANAADTHKTSFTGSSWTCAEKARLTTTVGTEYYLVVYCTNPNESVSLKEGSMGTAVGYPVMLAGHTNIYPNRNVSINSTGYTSTLFTVNAGTTIPKTAQVIDMTLYGITMSNIDRWRLMAPNQSFWVSNESSHYPAVDMNYKHNVSTNAQLVGTWQAAFKASSSSKTFTPYYKVTYYCEYGDE